MRISLDINTDNQTVSIHDVSGGTGALSPNPIDYRHLLRCIRDVTYSKKDDIYQLPSNTFKYLEEQDLL